MNTIDSLTLGLATDVYPAGLMQRPHRHNEIELNFIEQGAMTYLVGGRRERVEAGQVTLFWATIPHQVISTNEPVTLHWLTIPFAIFLQWQLPAVLMRPILGGKFVTNPDKATHQADQASFRQWHDDLQHPSTEQCKIVYLEVEARLRRLAMALQQEDITNVERHTTLPSAEISRVEHMACFIADHYTEQLRIEHIAQAVNLHPNYAVSLFRKQYGMGIVEYIIQYRVAHAQRLLVTTSKTVLEIAMEAGFGSVSRFYVAFKEMCGQTPVAYRASLHLSPQE